MSGPRFLYNFLHHGWVWSYPTCIPTIPLHHRAPETSHALPVRQTPRYGPVMPGTIRPGLSNAFRAPVTPERVTISHLSLSTCFSDTPR